MAKINSEMETVFVPKQSGEDPTLVVGLNGKNYLIPRGKHTEVPKDVAAIIHQYERATEAADAYRDSEKAKMKTVFGAPN